MAKIDDKIQEFKKHLVTKEQRNFFNFIMANCPNQSFTTILITLNTAF